MAMKPGDAVILLPYPDSARSGWVPHSLHAHRHLSRGFVAGGKTSHGCLRIRPPAGMENKLRPGSTFGWPSKYVVAAPSYEVSWR